MRQVLQMMAGAILLAGAAWLFVLAFGAETGVVGPVPPPVGRGVN